MPSKCMVIALSLVYGISSALLGPNIATERTFRPQNMRKSSQFDHTNSSSTVKVNMVTVN